ncbi:MAG TPA: hypothetical protein PKA93_00820, partial [Arachnia sp.]|nr:hypothetical protein [Arachnia sp.]
LLYRTLGRYELAELWAAANPDSLPGALWRLYLLRHTVREAPSAAAYRFRRGIEVDAVGQAIAGSSAAPTPDEVVSLTTQILRGAFVGDFAVALERAAAFSRVMGAGCRELAGSDADNDRAAEEHRRAESYDAIAGELTRATSSWRSGVLH